MKNFIDDLGITGHLTITKRWNDGTEEIVFDDHNVIVSGMGVGLSLLFTASGSTSITDFQIDRFQIGVSGDSTLEVSSTTSVSAPLTLAQYGGGTNLFISQNDQIIGNAMQSNRAFALIPFNKITRINDNSVRYTLVVDEETANDLTGDNAEDVNLNEIGLYMKNPLAYSRAASILVAYRSFSVIRKTSDFSLIFRWTLNF